MMCTQGLVSTDHHGMSRDWLYKKYADDVSGRVASWVKVVESFAPLLKKIDEDKLQRTEGSNSQAHRDTGVTNRRDLQIRNQIVIV